MKKTIGLSILLHVCFFTAALLWSAQLFDGSRGKQGERILFVRLMKEERGGAGEQTVAQRAQASTKAARVLTDTKAPDLRRLPFSGEQSVRISHDPELPVQDTAGLKDSDSENTGLHMSGPAETASFDEDVAARAFEGKYTAVTAGQDGGDSYIDTGLRAGQYKDGHTTGTTVHSVPSDVMDTIRNAIERVTTYPVAARRRGTEGVVHVSFRITPHGQPEQIRIVRSSGSPLLDMTTLDMVRRAAPFPYIEASLELPVVFRLD